MERISPQATAWALGSILLLLVLTAPAQAEGFTRSYDLALGAGVGGTLASATADCQADLDERACRTAQKALGRAPAIGGIELATDPVRGKRVSAQATDDLSALAPIALGIDVDGDGCIGCTTSDILYAGCGGVEGIVLHTTKGAKVSLFVSNLWVDPTTLAPCVATSGSISVQW